MIRMGFLYIAKQIQNNTSVALAEWLRRVPAKYMGFPRESSNLSGDVFHFHHELNSISLFYMISGVDILFFFLNNMNQWQLIGINWHGGILEANSFLFICDNSNFAGNDDPWHFSRAMSEHHSI